MEIDDEDEPTSGSDDRSMQSPTALSIEEEPFFFKTMQESCMAIYIIKIEFNKALEGTTTR